METEIEFLSRNRELINDCLDFIDSHFHSHSIVELMDDIGWKCVVVGEENWPELKRDPTQTSQDEHEIQILSSYANSNPGIFEFNDEYGWSFHEIVHALIFNGNIPDHFLEINSPFTYPLNADEIFCFGYQIRHIDEIQFGHLLDYYLEFDSDIGSRLEILRSIIR